MKLSLNLSTQRYRSPFVYKLLIALTIVLIILPFGLNAYITAYSNDAIKVEESKYHKELQRNRELENNLRQINNFLLDLNISKLNEKIDFYYDKIILMNLRWLRLVSALELLLPDDAKVRRITPQISLDDGFSFINLNIEGFSRDFDSVIELLTRLEASPLFENAYLTSIRDRLRELGGYEYNFQVIYLQPVE